MPDTAPRVSIIIPAYNEARRLPGTLTGIAAFLEATGNAAEILVVDDGSRDHTADVVRSCAAAYGHIRLIATPHRGKGHAVKTGMLQGRGEILLMADADLSVSIEQAWKLVPLAHQDDSIAIASREVPGAQRLHEPYYRHALGRIHNALIRSMLGLHISDTQCGFKCFHKTIARKLFSRQTLDGWGFDVELLYAASNMGCRIHEIPVVWRYDLDSRVKVVRDSFSMLRDLCSIRRNARQLQYRR